MIKTAVAMNVPRKLVKPGEGGGSLSQRKRERLCTGRVCKKHARVKKGGKERRTVVRKSTRVRERKARGISIGLEREMPGGHDRRLPERRVCFTKKEGGLCRSRSLRYRKKEGGERRKSFTGVGGEPAS